MEEEKQRQERARLEAERAKAAAEGGEAPAEGESTGAGAAAGMQVDEDDDQALLQQALAMSVQPDQSMVCLTVVPRPARACRRWAGKIISFGQRPNA